MTEPLTSQGYEHQGLYRRIVKRQGHYEDRRRPYDGQRDVIVELLRPDLVKGEVGQKDEGAFASSKIVEGTGPHAALVWQRGFQGNMVSRKTDWFRDRLKEPPAWTGVEFEGNDEVNQYLQDFTDHLAAVYRRSNYYDVLDQYILDGGTVGSPVMLYEHDIANDRIVCKVPDYAAVWLDKDIFGRDNCLHVKWEWTAKDAAEHFGKEQLPLVVRNQLDNGNEYETTKYIQAIYGAGDTIYKGLPESVPQTHPWLEHFICLGTQDAKEQKVLRPLHKGPGYFTRPFSTWHYHRNWHEVYSKTMAWWAVYDIRGGNAMWEALFGEAELSLKPPSWAPGSLRGQLDLSPGAGNWAEGKAEYDRPPIFLERPTRYDIAMDFTDRVAHNIRRWFHYDLFMAISAKMDQKTQPETAYGLMKADLERTTQLLPEVETFENQVLAHTHDVLVEHERMAAPAYPSGRLPEPPEIVQEMAAQLPEEFGGDDQITPEFMGELSRGQRHNRKVLQFYRGLGMIEMAFQVAPEVKHKIKWPQSIEGVLEALDFRQSDINSEEEYAAIVQALEQRAMQQELAEQAPKMAQAVKNLQGETKKGSPVALLTGAS